jgi:large subunit ribosomal protein L4
MSYSVTVYDNKWKSISNISLDDTIFSQSAINSDLLQEYVIMHLANQRVAIAHTKTRWEVAWSGKKLYRQKGKWHARVGDAWSPIRRKWWVAFWPRNTRNFSKDMNSKMKQKALLTSFILQADQNAIYWLQSFNLSSYSSKNANLVLKSLPCWSQKTLVILDTENSFEKKSIRNIPSVIFTHVSRLNAYDVMNAKHVLFVWESLQNFIDKFSS